MVTYSWLFLNKCKQACDDFVRDFYNARCTCYTLSFHYFPVRNRFANLTLVTRLVICFLYEIDPRAKRRSYLRRVIASLTRALLEGEEKIADGAIRSEHFNRRIGVR